MVHEDGERLRAIADRWWRGEADLAGEEHPVRVGMPGAVEIEPGLLYFKGVAALSVVDTGDGLVMLDAGTRRDVDRVYEAVRAWRPDVPLVAAVFSHHHVDHIWSVRRFDEESEQRGWPAPRVHAHALLPAHFDRYRRTRGWNEAINARQFGTGFAVAGWPSEYRYPDVTFERSMTLRVGKLSFELRHARGETDDHVWVHVPERGWIFPGDLFIWAVPNAGNPQKVQRYCEEWGSALREIAALDAGLLVCGHGVPIFGRDRIRQALVETAEYLESIERQTIALMNRGLPLDEILHRVRPPAHLLERPYLQAVYDVPQFLVRNVWRRYGGWWDGEPDSLLPAPRRQQAREWVALAGGVEPLLARVAALEAAGDLRMASHLVEIASLAEPESEPAADARARVYSARAAGEHATMTRGIFGHFAESARRRRRDLLVADDASEAGRAAGADGRDDVP
jgi:glyoxylase-like metal-dependent hydrolase (beta-lactamase superfamily II)